MVKLHQSISHINQLLILSFLLMPIILYPSCAQEKSSSLKGVKKNVSTKASKNQLSNSILKLANRLEYPSGIRSILQDSEGNYWFGSHQEGACLFNGETFTYFTVDDGLSDNQVRRIVEGKDEQIWFGTGNGVSSYKSGAITNHTAHKIIAAPGIPQLNWKLEEKDLWFNAGTRLGAYRYDGEQLHYLPFPTKKNEGAFNTYHVTGISNRKNGQLWLATYPALFGYDGQSFEVIDNEALGFNEETGFLHIRNVLEDSKGRVWICNNGIGVLLKNGDSIINFSEANGLIGQNSSLSGSTSPAGTLEHVFAIEEDQYGNIWFGDRDTGAWKYDGKTMTNYTQKDGLSSDFPHVIYKDNDGKLWFGMADGNIFQFNGSSFIQKFNG